VLRCGKNCDLVIKEWQGGKELNEHVIAINDIPLNNENKNGLLLADLFVGHVEAPVASIKYNRLKKVMPENSYRNYDVRSACRYYVSDSNLIISFNYFPDTAQILSISLRGFQIKMLKVSSGVPIEKNDQSVNNNVFLVDNKVLYIAACKKELIFKIFDLTSGMEIKNFTTSIESPTNHISGGLLPFQDDPLHHIREQDNNIKILTLLHKIRENDYDPEIGIGAFINNDNQLEVTVALGHYLFRTSLDRLTLEPVTSENRLSDLEKMGAEIKRLKKENELQALSGIIFRNKLILSYYQPAMKKFYVSAFNADKK